MQTFHWALVPLLFVLNASYGVSQGKPAAPPRTHAVTLGPGKSVPFTPPEADAANRREETVTVRVRALFVDTRQREWTMGEAHDVTDRSFVVRRALRINDRLPGEAADRWVWQPGPWLLVDRVTGRIAVVRLPDFDPVVSDVVWFRDFGAYCGVGGRGGLVAVVAQIGGRKAVAQKQIGSWPQANHFIPVCKAAVWERGPMRVTMQATGGEASTFAVVGTAAIVEEGDGGDEN
ncbi:hypothetical protein SAMN05421771_0997 [Granulicella pectinivorans]|jgi:hypothetical protein|uniref:Uncharacterized protein n=1 Tax=Granulicella pectinivorans TaxID=474950 RepID=A0A1I6LNB2_9BACT|nr:hypothetical protein [Granulicella pectinivorans]SFS04899.1 hypothetical protein SAMN05421771_0997 [Granulicella pectinivorans]